MEDGVDEEKSRREPVVTMIEISKIEIGQNRRPVDKETVEQLVQSIQSVGLLSPITVTKDFKLIAGSHRIEAYKQLGREIIPGIVIDLSDLESELAELEENSCRAELSALGRAENLFRRKAIYEDLHPETRQGGPRRSESEKKDENAPRFTKVASGLANTSERSIQRLIQIAETLSQNVKDLIRETPIADSLKDLNELCKAQETERIQVATIIKEAPI